MEEQKVSHGVATGKCEKCYSEKKSHVQVLMLFPTKEKGENETESYEYKSKGSKSLSIDGQKTKVKRPRLSEVEVIMLEDTLRDHKRITSFKKHVLADKLKLKPKQVEHWFNYRRARNKSNDKERESKELKKVYETLKKENQMLKEELHHLMLKQKGR